MNIFVQLERYEILLQQWQQQVLSPRRLLIGVCFGRAVLLPAV